MVCTNYEVRQGVCKNRCENSYASRSLQGSIHLIALHSMKSIEGGSACGAWHPVRCYPLAATEGGPVAIGFRKDQRCGR